MTAPGVHSTLIAAVREVNAAYYALAEEDRPEVRWDGLDDELERALLGEDRDQALRVIEAWRGHWMHELGRAGG